MTLKQLFSRIEKSNKLFNQFNLRFGVRYDNFTKLTSRTYTTYKAFSAAVDHDKTKPWFWMKDVDNIPLTKTKRHGYERYILRCTFDTGLQVIEFCAEFSIIQMNI